MTSALQGFLAWIQNIFDKIKEVFGFSPIDLRMSSESGLIVSRDTINSPYGVYIEQEGRPWEDYCAIYFPEAGQYTAAVQLKVDR